MPRKKKKEEETEVKYDDATSDLLKKHLEIIEKNQEEADEHATNYFMGKPVSYQRKFNDELAARFLAYFSMTGRIGDSARAAGLNHSTVVYWKQHDKDFAALYEEANQVHLSRLERELYRRAVEGVQKAVYNKDGDIVGYDTIYSDRLLEFMLRKADPEGYGNKPRKEDVEAGAVGRLVVPVQFDMSKLPLQVEYVEEVEDAELID